MGQLFCGKLCNQKHLKLDCLLCRHLGDGVSGESSIATPSEFTCSHHGPEFARVEEDALSP